MSAADFSSKVRAQVLERAGGKCEGCGRYRDVELHHRQYKSRGGKGTVENALALCGWGNHTGCHGIAHSADGEWRGWSIRSGFDPALWPARRWLDTGFGTLRLGWVIYFDALDEDGAWWRVLTDEEAAELMEGRAA